MATAPPTEFIISFASIIVFIYEFLKKFFNFFLADFFGHIVGGRLVIMSQRGGLIRLIGGVKYF